MRKESCVAFSCKLRWDFELKDLMGNPHIIVQKKFQQDCTLERGERGIPKLACNAQKQKIFNNFPKMSKTKFLKIFENF